MDPLSALSLATSVVQFVQFVFSLINGTQKIYKTCCGISVQAENINEIYQRLYELSGNLETHHGTVIPSKAYSALKGLAIGCKEDYDEWITIVENLVTRGKSSRKR
ncbi:hypothetical protein F5884DRAFT_379393 [Xylogone sp. PMI_703]|nr:hypothetical protein F5884DRAFT_379393 [Xylogone sp. PMI_703]